MVNEAASPNPSTSVLVTLTSGKKLHLRRCLSDLMAQDVATEFEVIVPFDAPVREVSGLAEEFPAVRFFEVMGEETLSARQGKSREHHDRLRTLGLKHCRGSAIAFCEDHARLAPDWLKNLHSALERHRGAGAIGGAVLCQSTNKWNLAVYCCDFLRYAPPFSESETDSVSDTNVIYPREALRAVESSYAESYSEPRVHAALRQSGFLVVRTPDARTWQDRDPQGLRDAVSERRVWGQSFGGARSRPWPLLKRLLLAPLCGILPFVLTWRVLKQGLRTGNGSLVLRLLPRISVLQLAWSLGEAWGTVTGRAEEPMS